MRSFDFVNARTLGEALALLSAHGQNALVAAGSTNIMENIRANAVNGLTLINIRDIRELRGISIEEDVITIGALTEIAKISESRILKEKAPALWMAADAFADPIIRNSATIGGNIAFSSPAADTAPPLLALGACVDIANKDGRRSVQISDFFRGVNQNILEPGDIITGFRFMVQRQSGFYKLGLRNAMAISVASAAVSLELDDEGKIKAVRIAMGSVAPVPVRCRCTEKALTGCKLDGISYAKIAQALQNDINPIDDIRASASYRRSVSPVCVKRAAELALYGEFKCGGL